MKTKNFFINRAEKRLNNGFSFDSLNYDNIIEELELENEQYEYISWEELKEELINNGWKYCYWEDSVITDEYAKELGLIEDYEDDDNDEGNDDEDVLYTKDCFINRAKEVLSYRFKFDKDDYEYLIKQLESENAKYEHITWEELKDKLISNGCKYYDLGDSIITNKYEKHLELLDCAKRLSNREVELDFYIAKVRQFYAS